MHFAFRTALLTGLIAFSSAPYALAQGFLPPTAGLLLRYDTDQDSRISRAEMEAGVSADYALSDVDGDRCINNLEMRVENERRLSRDGGVASPVADWNLDGCVDMTEFGSSVRSYFNYADHSKDDAVTTAELQGPSMPIGLPEMPSLQPEPSQMGTSTLEQNPYDSSLPGNF